MGGFIALRDEELCKKASMYSIMFEGYLTYGGMSGRDMNAWPRDWMKEPNLNIWKPVSVRWLIWDKNCLIMGFLSVMVPFGGHAIFVDAKKFLPNVPKEEFIAQTLAVELYVKAGFVPLK